MGIGVFTDYCIASILGIISVYFLYYTSIENFLLKGFIIGAGGWLIIFIPITQAKVSRINPDTISSNISFLIGHLLLGILISFFIVKYGRELLINFRKEEK